MIIKASACRTSHAEIQNSFGRQSESKFNGVTHTMVAAVTARRGRIALIVARISTTAVAWVEAIAAFASFDCS